MPEKQLPPLVPVVISTLTALVAVARWLLAYYKNNSQP